MLITATRAGRIMDTIPDTSAGLSSRAGIIIAAITGTTISAIIPRVADNTALTVIGIRIHIRITITIAAVIGDLRLRDRQCFCLAERSNKFTS